MPNVKLIQVLQDHRFFILAAFASLLILGLYVYLQLLGITQNLGVWLVNLAWYNAVLLFSFCVLFGATFAYQVFLWSRPNTCPIDVRVKGTVPHTASGLTVLFVAQCPGCATFTALFLPASTVTFLGQINWLLNLFSIGLLVFTLHYLGAFQNTIEGAPIA
ncbi:MAG: hypothetical protein Q7R47_02105 [Candidatus Diapherotrites archaeon]|nr:hypothetical protein [Candidatus Diapherotrites archaeon]